MKRICAFLLIVFAIGCGPKVFKTEWTKEISPEKYSARFKASKGDFDIEDERRLSPKASDRFYQLIRHNYFDNMLIYFVKPGFVAQFGTSDTLVLKNWSNTKVPDEVVVQGNKRGTLSFAMGGKESRGTDLF